MILKPDTTRRANKIFFLLIISWSVFASCSGNDKSNTTEEETTETEGKAATSTKDACALLTEEDAKAILGNAITKGMSTATMCQYVSASEELSKTGESVSIQLQPGAASEFDTYVSTTEKDLNVKARPVSGIADKAVFAGGQLIVSKGNDFVIVIVGKNMPEEEQIAAEKNLAQKVIDRMASK